MTAMMMETTPVTYRLPFLPRQKTQEDTDESEAAGHSDGLRQMWIV